MLLFLLPAFIGLATFGRIDTYPDEFSGEGGYVDLHGHFFYLIFLEGLVYYFFPL